MDNNRFRRGGASSFAGLWRQLALANATFLTHHFLAVSGENRSWERDSNRNAKLPAWYVVPATNRLRRIQRLCRTPKGAILPSYSRRLQRKTRVDIWNPTAVQYLYAQRAPQACSDCLILISIALTYIYISISSWLLIDWPCSPQGKTQWWPPLMEHWVTPLLQLSEVF